MAGEWYTINVLKKVKIFTININKDFNINTVLWNTTWKNPKIFYTYDYIETLNNKFDTSIKLINKGNGVYNLTTDSSVSNNSICKVMVYEGDI